MNRVLEEFKKITKIPRPSFHEEKIRDYLYDWAIKRNIFVEKDEFKNVFMKKPASKGYESFSPVALQAHIDMVCESAIGVKFDFLNDPIEIFIDGDIVSTHNRTSLGADNGLGVSTILSILEDDSIKHPSIEAIFTSCEEEDFSGANGFDASKISAKYFINLDHCKNNEILSSSAGGVTVNSTKILEKIILDDDHKTYKVTIEGLLGGHSGEDINKGRGNSNILLFRFLNSLNFNYNIIDINGGSFRLAIPRESYIEIAISKNDISNFEQKIEMFSKILKEEFQSNKNIKIHYIETENKSCYSSKFNKDIENFILLGPVDIEIMSDSFPNVVSASCNIGEIYIKENMLTVISDIRANFDSQREFIVNKILLLANLTNFKTDVWGGYYSWKYKKDSKLRELAKEIYDKNNDEKTKILSIHAGLECGFFAHKIPELDIISIGPDSWDFHSPKESFSISSVNKFYKNLVEILENIKF